MAFITIEQQPPITRDRLRAFHITGRGLESAAPKEPLHPAVLDRMPSFSCSSIADLPELYGAALASTRGKARAALLETIQKFHDRLDEMIAIDDTRIPGAASAQVISTSLGARAGLFFDAAALAQALYAPGNGPQRLEPDRRARIERTIAMLDQFLSEARNEPPYYMFSVGQNEQCSDAFAAALDFCDKQLKRFTGVLRAVRVARLEAESAFDPFHHEPLLERFDWQSADGGELAAMPPVVVLESVERLAQMSLTSFGRVLRSGRPVHILITSCGLFADDLSGFVPDFGYMAIAHREAFVLQSSLARPDHLREGLEAVVGTLRPAVAVLCVPPARFDESRSCAEASLLHVSRSFPLFSYDPDRGDTWAERFRLAVEEDLGATLADAAALSPDYLAHFRVVPEEDWNDEFIEINEYLNKYRGRPPLAIPYIQLSGGGRAIITRELANLVRDRKRAWRIFEELAGVNNAYAEAAAAKARIEIRNADTERDEKVKLEGATEAVRRVVAMLTGGAAAPVAAPARPAEPLPHGRGSEAVRPAEPLPHGRGSERVWPEPASEDPYIDSFLCTSCNDCFKINNRLFAYDGNKQAYIADARAGTFAELVKAAEGCPAKCIHPGTPRPDDQTVTPQLLAKADRLK